MSEQRVDISEFKEDIEKLSKDEFLELMKLLEEVRESKPTRRVTVKVPTITMSHSSKRLREKNREIIKSLKSDEDKLFSF